MIRPGVGTVAVDMFQHERNETQEEELEARAAIFEELFKDHPALEASSSSCKWS